MKRYPDSWNTDARLCEAIEAITGGSLYAGDGYPEECDDPAIVLWVDGGRDDAIRDWLDSHYPGWRDDAPLQWGASELTA